ncbi:MAG: hypothetical protein HY722_02060, partial [Planctomycetes bacterium]|nr:hypothetical protein [Planctomycetota bacterium]
EGLEPPSAEARLALSVLFASTGKLEAAIAEARAAARVGPAAAGGAEERLQIYAHIALNRPEGARAGLHAAAARMEVLALAGRDEEAPRLAAGLATHLREQDAAGLPDPEDREALLADPALAPSWATPEGETLRGEWVSTPPRAGPGRAP